MSIYVLLFGISGWILLCLIFFKLRDKKKPAEKKVDFDDSIIAYTKPIEIKVVPEQNEKDRGEIISDLVLDMDQISAPDNNLPDDVLEDILDEYERDFKIENIENFVDTTSTNNSLIENSDMTKPNTINEVPLQIVIDEGPELSNSFFDITSYIPEF